MLSEPVTITQAGLDPVAGEGRGGTGGTRRRETAGLPGDGFPEGVWSPAGCRLQCGSLQRGLPVTFLGMRPLAAFPAVPLHWRYFSSPVGWNKMPLHTRYLPWGFQTYEVLRASPSRLTINGMIRTHVLGMN